ARVAAVDLVGDRVRFRYGFDDTLHGVFFADDFDVIRLAMLQVAAEALQEDVKFTPHERADATVNVPRPELARVVVDGVDVDFAGESGTGQQVRERLVAPDGVGIARAGLAGVDQGRVVQQGVVDLTQADRQEILVGFQDVAHGLEEVVPGLRNGRADLG